MRSSLLAGNNGDSMPMVSYAALEFGRNNPLDTVSALMVNAGIDDPENLRECYPVPDEPCICRETSVIRPLRVDTASPNEVLQQVLLLSLCTATYFDPNRPVLLTTASLTRRLELFSGRGFYA